MSVLTKADLKENPFEWRWYILSTVPFTRNNHIATVYEALSLKQLSLHQPTHVMHENTTLLNKTNFNISETKASHIFEYGDEALYRHVYQTGPLKSG